MYLEIPIPILAPTNPTLGPDVYPLAISPMRTRPQAPGLFGFSFLPYLHSCVVYLPGVHAFRFFRISGPPSAPACLLLGPYVEHSKESRWTMGVKVGIGDQRFS
jgi:hypothetical protein